MVLTNKMLAKSVLVYGGSGALGKALARTFEQNKWTTFTCDVTGTGTKHVSLQAGGSMLEHFEKINNFINGEKLDAILCVSGGFAFGNAADEKNLFQGTEAMITSSLYASMVSAALCTKTLKKGGLLVLPGAAAILDSATPQLLGYGTAKAAVHHLIRSLAATQSGMPDGCKVVGIAPVILDTPANHESMPEAEVILLRYCYISLFMTDNELDSSTRCSGTNLRMVERSKIILNRFN
eukprot:GHVL01023750.1.p1 GENE.GHVL01023750.1~~GHVL01023750.1.p1  ORF type:complete len:237 (-),score=29.35 GHVL01023750.1:68-778(-)